MFLFDAILLPTKSTQFFLPLCPVWSAHEQLSRAITLFLQDITQLKIDQAMDQTWKLSVLDTKQVTNLVMFPLKKDT